MGLLEVDMAAWAALAGLVVTLLTDVVTRLNASSEVKALVNLFLAAIAGALVSISTNTGDLNTGQVVFTIVFTWLTSVVSYRHLTTPLKVHEKVAGATADFGVGGSAEKAAGH